MVVIWNLSCKKYILWAYDIKVFFNCWLKVGVTYFKISTVMFLSSSYKHFQTQLKGFETLKKIRFHNSVYHMLIYR